MTNKLRIVPLGGLGEIGKNMMVYEFGKKAIIVDTGIMFPENDMLGIDYIIPDFSYLLDRIDLDGLEVLAIIITHGHEDHTGAIRHVLEDIRAPIYATRLTAGLLENKLKQAKMLEKADLRVFAAGDTLDLDPFTVETFHVCHSIPDCVGVGITTPAGLVVHTGDFKFDHTPVDGWPTDFSKLAEFGGRGVLALLSDSTNADSPGWTRSEAVIDEGFDRVFRNAQGRILVASFASLISRIQQVANVTQRYGRKLAAQGTTMINNIKIATNLGYLDMPPGLYLPLDQIKRLPPEKVVIMTTGTQGEPSAVLSRLAQGRHRHLNVEPDDTIIISAHPIPGNEEMVSRTINKLIQRGANVIYDPIEAVHVSGHASQEEQKLMLNIVKPKFFVPVHGELRHLTQHAELAKQVGIDPECITVVENGTVIEFEDGEMRIGERVPGGYIFVDGLGVGDVGPAVIRDREILGNDGFVVVTVVVDKQTGKLLREPQIVSRGFVYLREADDLFAQASAHIRDTIENMNGSTGIKKRTEKLESSLKTLFHRETKRRPMTFVHIVIVTA